MALTAVQHRALLNRKLGPWCALADIDDAFSRALSALGLTIGTYGTLVDGDFTAVTDALRPQLLDIAEYEALEAACNNADDVMLRSVGISISAADAQRELARKVQLKLQLLRQKYAYGTTELQVGVVDLNNSADGAQTVY